MSKKKLNLVQEQAGMLARTGSFWYRTLSEKDRDTANKLTRVGCLTRVHHQMNSAFTAVQSGGYFHDYYKLIRFNDADIEYYGTEEALQKRYKRGNAVVRGTNLIVPGYIATDESGTIITDSTSGIVAPTEESYQIELPANFRITFGLRIAENLCVHSIELKDSTLLLNGIDFVATYGFIAFPNNPIALFPEMKFMAKHITYRDRNLLSYTLRVNNVYGSVDRIMEYYRVRQNIPSLYLAAAQACGLAVTRKECVVRRVLPLHQGASYIMEDGTRYDAPYRHTILSKFTTLPANYIIGGSELFKLYWYNGPNDVNELPGIDPYRAIPTRDVFIPNNYIVTHTDGKFMPNYFGSGAEEYKRFLEARGGAAEATGEVIANGMQDFLERLGSRWIVCDANKELMSAKMQKDLLTFLDREAPLGSVLLLAGEDTGQYEQLPDGYTRVNYLRSKVGNFEGAYFQTDVKWAGFTVFDVDFMSISKGWLGAVFSALNTGGLKDNIVSLSYSGGLGGNTLIRYGTQQNYSMFKAVDGTRYNFLMDKEIPFVDGTKLKPYGGTGFVYEGDFVSANSVWIAATRQGNTPITAAINFYRFTIKDAIHVQDGNLAMRDYIPVVTSDGTPVLFDLVTRRGCPNAGSGNFSIGVEGKDQLFTLLDNVPSTTEGLRIIVPMEEQLWLSESVLTTIKTACENGWDIVKASNESDPYLVTALRELIAAQVGEGNYSVTFTYDNKTCVIALASSITLEQCEEMLELARQILPSTFNIEFDYVPTDYTQTAFVESTGAQKLTFNVTDVSYVASDVILAKFAGALFSQSLNPYRLRFLYHNTRLEWQYEFPPSTSTYKISPELGINQRYLIEADITNKSIKINGVTATLTRVYAHGGASDVSDFNVLSNFYAKLHKLKITHSDGLIDCVPALDNTGTPCMFDTGTRTPYYNAGSGAFIVGIKTKEQLLKLISNLPTKTASTLKLSLPITLLPDEDVNNAFISALDKGWTIVVHEWLEDENAVATGYTPIAYLENASAGQGIYTSITSIDQKIIEIKAKSASKNDVLFGQYPYVDGTRYRSTMQWDEAYSQYLFNARSPNRLVQYWQPDIEFFTGTSRVYRFNTVDNTLTVDDIEGSITSYSQTTKFNDLPFALMGLTYVNTDLTYYLSSKVGTCCHYCKLSASDGTLEANYIACLDNEGIPCMYDTVGKQVYYNAGDGSFLVGFENDIQLVTALSRLPIASSEQTLTVRVPEEVLASESVQQLIQYYAEEKNWTLIIS